MTDEDMNALVALYAAQRMGFSGFMNNVTDFFRTANGRLFDTSGKFVVHSVKSREKEDAHLRAKILRKEAADGVIIEPETLFQQVTDFCGVRILHLKRSDFAIIHAAIIHHVANQHWQFFEDPKAYTWDPESKTALEALGLATEMKESHYTSVHYVVKPNAESVVTCEIQVRSLFEEIWGEIDHDLNYPAQSEVLACREQLKVLAKLVGAGTRLVDSIYSSLEPPAPAN
jgi:ppGpp synthetase/RelA/SpoT-type nucleotidyltranferase